MDVRTLDELHLAALREVVNIGAGHAATALSQLMQNQSVLITVPSITVVPAVELLDVLQPPEQRLAAVSMRLLGDLSGETVLVFPEVNARGLCRFLLEDSGPDDGKPLGELQQSTLREVGNILASAYLTALSNFAGIMVVPSVPTLVQDDASTISHALGETQPDGTIVCAATEFVFGDGEPAVAHGGRFLHLVDPDSLPRLFEALDLA